MKALILVGGYGTRLRPLTCTRPKPLFPIANQPILEWVIHRLTKYNVDEVILAIHYRSEQIQRHFGDGAGLGVKIIYSKEEEPLDTGGPIKLAEKYLGSGEPFYVLNSDIVCYLDYSELLNFHKKKGALGTIALHYVDDPSRYGVVELGENYKIKNFIEKPTKEQAPSNLINAGIYVLDPAILDMIPTDRPFSSEKELFPRLAAMNRLFGYEVTGVWIDTGKPEDYLAANEAVLNQEYNRLTVAENVEIPKSAKIIPPVLIGDGCIIGENSQIGPNVSLNNRVRVEDGVSVKDSIIFPKVKIGKQSSIKRTILGEGVVLGKSVKIDGETLIGDFVRVADNITIVSGVAICPWKKIKTDILSPQKIM